MSDTPITDRLERNFGEMPGDVRQLERRVTELTREVRRLRAAEPAQELPKVAIGSDIWLYDENRRVYPRDANGREHGSPIYRAHWVKHTIVDENRVSWFTNFRQRVPKRGGPGVAFSEQEVDDACWFHEHRYKVVRKLEIAASHHRPADCARWLRNVAKLVDYVEGSDPKA